MASVLSFVKNKWNNDRKSFALYAGATIGIIASSVWAIKYAMKKNTEMQMKKFEEESKRENKVILHGFGETSVAAPTISPACVKMIAFLEYTKIPYSLDDKIMFAHPKTGKSPWITYKDKHIADSNVIIDFIKNEKSLNNIDIDNHLNKSQKAIFTAYKALVEDCIYFILAYRRWYNDENVKKYLQIVFESASNFEKILIGFFESMIVDSVRKQIWSQGTARLPSDVIYKNGIDAIESILEYMGDNKFFFGEKLTTLDLTIYGHVGGMYQVPLKWDYKHPLPNKQRINEYMKNIEMECFGELRYWKDIV